MSRSRYPVLLGAGLIFVAKVATSVPRLTSSAPLVAITWLTVLSFLVVGVVLLHTDIPPINGWSCVFVAASTIPGDLDEPSYVHAWLTPVGYVLEYGYLAAAVALVLRYPRDRLTAIERWCVGVLVAAAVGVRIPIVLTSGRIADGFHPPPDWPRARLSWWHDWLLLRGGHAVTIVVLLAAAGLLAGRARRLTGLARQAQLPLVVVTAVCAVCAAVDQSFWLTGSDWQFSWVPAMARDSCAAAMPVAILAGLLRRRSAGASIAERVVLAAGSGSVVDLQGALRNALAAPSLALTVAATDGLWLDADGRQVSPPVGRSAPTRVVVVRDHAGTALCAVDFGPTCGADEALLQAALAAARLGMSNTRLQADLAARRQDLLAAHARVVEAGISERRRVERDLHDGAQQRFLAVAATLARADLVPVNEALAVVKDARLMLGEALGELRELARGNSTAVLERDGLLGALERVCASAPLPVARVLDDRLERTAAPRETQAAVFFVVAEGLTNAARYSGAGAVHVRVDVVGDVIQARVSDDGVGGARTAPGGGLSGLADRVAALGGRLQLTSGAGGHGTVLEAVLPTAAAAADADRTEPRP